MEKNKSNQIYSVSKSKNLNTKLRRILQNPERVLGKYLDKGMTVLDVGCGPGFFSVEMAKIVGKNGKVIAADIQKGMLDKLKDTLNYLSVKNNIVLHKTNKNKIGVNEKTDFILAFYVLHEVDNQENFFKELKSIMKPKSKFLLSEPVFHVSKNDFEEIVGKAEALGFRILERPKILLSRSVLMTL